MAVSKHTSQDLPEELFVDKVRSKRHAVDESLHHAELSGVVYFNQETSVMLAQNPSAARLMCTFLEIEYVAFR